MSTAARFVGAPIRRVEDARLVTGHGTFVDDIVVPGAREAAILRSPHAHARIASIDPSEALALPGVHAVLVAADLNPKVQVMRSAYMAADNPLIRPLAQHVVRFVGDPVAVVVADDRYVAEDAAELVDVRYEPLAPLVDVEAAADDELLVWPELGTNIAFAMASDVPADLEAALAGAHLVLDRTFRQQRQAIVPMECRGLVASWDSRAGEMRVWISHQLPHEVRAFTSRLLGIPANRVRVTQQDVGGGFGQKAAVAREEAAIILASHHLGYPVKWIEDRWENLTAAGHAREELIRVRMGFEADGTITAAAVDHTEGTGAYGLGGYNGKWVGVMFPGPYRVPTYAYTARCVYTHTGPRVPYRGPWMVESVGREALLDIAARALGMDPLELRRRNVITDEEQPLTTAGGMDYDRLSLSASLDQLADVAGYDDLRDEQAKARAEGRLVGIGLSAYVEPTAKAGPLGVEVATVRLELDGSVNVLMGTGSHGQSLETTMVQIVADELGVDMGQVRLIQGDTDAVPHGGGTGGSRSAVIGGAAAHLGAQKLAAKVRGLAAHLLEAAEDDLELVEGAVQVRGTPARRRTLAELADTAYLHPERLPADMEPGLEATSRWAAPPVTFSNASHLCMVEVDPETGSVEILRYVVSEDCGVMINPLVVDGQVAGGVVQGIGGTLYEEFRYDDDGNPLTTTFLDYGIPTVAEVPVIEIAHIETPAHGPGGHKGVGEGGVIGAVPAVLNAVADALAPLGVEVTALPLSPDRIVALLEGAPT